MKLLIITQKVDINDDVLGFFHGWIKEFAKHCEFVTVICLQKGDYDLPENVKVFSLGKEKGISKFKYILNFYKYIWRERKNYDIVFVHMNQEYVLLGGLFWRMMGKKIALWYAHKAVNVKLKIAEKLVDKIFTPSKESFRLPSKKVEITGHGIDTEKFKNQKSKVKNEENAKFKIISVGRISPVKNYDLLVDAAEILKSKNIDYDIKIAGAPILESDKKYFEKLKEKIKEKQLEDKIKFVGPIPNKDIIDFYQEGDLFVNFSDTGSIDKAVLEAMACGLKILTSNEAFRGILKEENFTEKNPENIAGKIINLAKNETDGSLAEYAVKNHSLENLVKKIINFFKQ